MRRAGVSLDLDEVLGVGDEFGLVGNPGNTTEPRLHMHAVGPQEQRRSA